MLAWQRSPIELQQAPTGRAAQKPVEHTEPCPAQLPVHWVEVRLSVQTFPTQQAPRATVQGVAVQLELAVNTAPPPAKLHAVSVTSRQVPVAGLQQAPVAPTEGQEPGQVPLAIKVPLKAQAPGTQPSRVQQTPEEAAQVLTEQVPPLVQVPVACRQLIWVSTEQVVPTQQLPVAALGQSEQLEPRPASVVPTPQVP